MNVCKRLADTCMCIEGVWSIFAGIFNIKPESKGAGYYCDRVFVSLNLKSTRR